MRLEKHYKKDHSKVQSNVNAPHTIQNTINRELI